MFYLTSNQVPIIDLFCMVEDRYSGDGQHTKSYHNVSGELSRVIQGKPIQIDQLLVHAHNFNIPIYNSYKT